jgi:NitT/TauT family transport system permease protein
VVAVLVGLAFWQALVQLHALPTYMLPAPSAVWTTGWALTRNGSLWHHVSITLAEAMLGFAIAFAVGASTAYPLAKSRLVASILSPYIAGTQAMPIIALAPLLLVWFGFGLVPKAIICALIVFFPILINTAVGLRTVDQAAVEAAQTEGANAWQILWHVEVPMGLRTILSGIRIGLTLSITGAIVAEFVASAAGLGYLMTLARSQYDSPLLFVACLSVVALAVLGYLVVGLLEIALIDWD